MFKLLKISHNFAFRYSSIIIENNLVKKNVYRAIVANRFCDDVKKKPISGDTQITSESKKFTPSPVVSSKYETISEENATIILDVEEEREKMLAGQIDIGEVEESGPDIYEGLNTNRGVTGVFDIEDLVEVLKRDNAKNIFVCTVPAELKYVDYLCIITARSPRHMKAITQFVRKMYKKKRTSKDRIPRIEGKQSDEWMAMDMGNIALHVFSAKTRTKYDVEMLWTVGTEFDTESNKPEDPLLEMYERNSMYLDDLSPADSTELPLNEEVSDASNRKN